MSVVSDFSGGSFNYGSSSSPLDSEFAFANSFYAPNDSSVGNAIGNAIGRFVLPRSFASAESRYNAAKAAEVSEWQATRNRQWQEYMSNTAYQRAVSDMKKAGLNPILAFGSAGASAPGGSTGRSSSAGSPSYSGLSDVLLGIAKLFAGIYVASSR